MRSNTTRAQRQANTIKQLCMANAVTNGYTLGENSTIMIFIIYVHKYNGKRLCAWGCLISDGMFIKLFNTNTIFTHEKFSIRNRKCIGLAHTRHTVQTFYISVQAALWIIRKLNKNKYEMKWTPKIPRPIMNSEKFINYHNFLPKRIEADINEKYGNCRL